MIRPGTVVWFCLVVAVGYAMFQVKYQVMLQEQTLAGINKQITDDREQIRVLDAEWTYLTRPARLQQLADRFLHLQSMNSSQIVDLSAIPLRDTSTTPLIAGAPATTPGATPADASAQPARPGAHPASAADTLAAQFMSPRIAAAIRKPVP